MNCLAHGYRAFFAGARAYGYSEGMRKYVVLIAGLCVVSGAIAQSYPSRPIRWVAPSASGSTSDSVATWT